MSNICVITCHGFTGYPKEMEPLGEYLVEKGYHWHNLTIPGHDTSPEDLKTKKWTDWTDYVKNEINKKLNDYHHVFVSGLSMGGIMTLWALENFPSLKGGMSMASPIQLLNPIQRFLTKLPLPGWWIGRSETDVRDINDEETRKNHIAYETFHTDSVIQLLKLVTNMRKNLDKITQPVLLIHSKKDKVIPVENIHKIYNKIPSDKKEKFLVENSGHVLTRDLDRFAIFEKIHQFIQANV